MTKRLVALFFVLCLLMPCMATADALPVETPSEPIQAAVHDYLVFENMQGGLRVAGCKADTVKASIPASWNGLPVLEIGSNAFNKLDKLERVTVAEGVKIIRANAFRDCESLEYLSLPESVETIEAGAITGCPLLIVSAPKNSKAYKYAKDNGLLKPEATEAPVIEATTEPTAEPINEPTTEPVIEPTSEPVSEPTAEPVTEPTSEPVVEPTTEPVIEHTSEPVVEPTTEPVPEPTTEPTSEPTIEPLPTAEPAPVLSDELQIRIVGGSIVVGGSQLKLSAEYTTGIKADDVSWSIIGDSRMKISSKGVLTTKTVTSTVSCVVTATAKWNPALSASLTVNILPRASRVIISAPSAKISLVNPTMQLTAVCLPTGSLQAVTWKSSKPKIASIDKNGLVTALSTGTTVITATAADGSGKKATYQLTVIQRPLVESVEITAPDDKITISVNPTMQLTAVCTPTDSLQTVSWSSDNTAIASVDSTGLVTGHSAGVVTITATAADGTGKNVAKQLTIIERSPVESVEIINAETELDLANPTLQLTAVCNPSDSAQNVQWSSNAADIATVDENGLVTAHKVGSVAITATATDGTGKTATVQLTVTDIIGSQYTTEAVTGGVQITAYTGLGGDVVVPSSIGGKTVVGFTSEVFKGNDKITSIALTAGIDGIPDYAFAECVELKCVTMPNSLATIGSYAFRGCKKLNGITLPESLKNISVGTFSGLFLFTVNTFLYGWFVSLPQYTIVIPSPSSSLTSSVLPEVLISFPEKASFTVFFPQSASGRAKVPFCLAAEVLIIVSAL